MGKKDDGKQSSSDQVKKRRPSNGVNYEANHTNNENNDIEKIKHKPAGESSKKEFNEVKVDENKYSRKIK